jgi:DNA-binding beta-propeller fold protein YncE
LFDYYLISNCLILEGNRAMKWMFVKLSFVLLLLVSGSLYATSGALVDISSYGTMLFVKPVNNRPYSAFSLSMDAASNAEVDRVFSVSGTDIPTYGSYQFFLPGTGAWVSFTSGTGALTGHTCLKTTPPLACQTFSMNVTQKAYISNSNSATISSCDLDAEGALASCATATTSGVSIAEPYQMVFNQTNTIAHLVSRSQNSVFRCLVNANGVFSNCADSGNTGVVFDAPAGMVVNRAGTYAFVTNQGPGGTPGVSVCPIRRDGFFGPCVASGNTGIAMGCPNGIALNRDESRAYVVDPCSNRVAMCPILADKTFGPCVNTGNSGVAFVGPRNLAITPLNVAYVTNPTGNFVLKCAILPVSGLFGPCVNAGGSGFSGPSGITLSKAAKKAYMVDSVINRVFACPIRGDGLFGTCVPSTNALLSGPLQIALN